MIVEQAKRDTEAAQMRTQMAEMAALLERQTAIIDELQARPRGPGRPRKPEGQE
jgi:hypothetical protein